MFWGVGCVRGDPQGAPLFTPPRASANKQVNGDNHTIRWSRGRWGHLGGEGHGGREGKLKNGRMEEQRRKTELLLADFPSV